VTIVLNCDDEEGGGEPFITADYTIGAMGTLQPPEGERIARALVARS
jgi:hypothetical protein